MTNAMLTATYTKLRNGDWGLRVESETAQAEDIVLACTKGGKKTRKMVTKVLWRGNGITLCEMGDAPKGAKVAAKPAPEPKADEDYGFDLDDSSSDDGVFF